MLELNDKTKTMLNILQNYLVQSYESDYILLIFDNQAELLKYKRAKKYMCQNEILITINELCNSNFLDGLRYKRYVFVTDNSMKNE